MRVLDLFCGAGGASQGYSDAGFEVVGVDINPQPHYPFEFRRGNALITLLAEDLSDYDLIHASPPCQAYSDLANRNGNAESWPRLVGAVRELLKDSGRPYVIENVEGAPIQNPAVLCGTMFPGLRVLRHRLFETTFHVDVLTHGSHPLVFTHDKRKGHYGKLDQNYSFVQVTGGGNCSVANARDAMGIGWMTKSEINEAVPPAYTQYLGEQFLRSSAS